MDNISKNIRKNEIKKAFSLFLYGIIFTGMAILLGVTSDGDGSLLFITCLIGFFAIVIDYNFIKAVIVAFNPNNSDLYKKYGSSQNISEILNEIEQSKILQYKNLIISDKYIVDKNDYSKLVACNDVLGIHKLVHKTNFRIDYFNIVITDKYGTEISYFYTVDEEDKCNEHLNIIAQKCNNAELGFTQDEFDHIQRNKTELKNTATETLYCPNCLKTVEAVDKFCKNCATKLDNENNIKETFTAVFKSEEQKKREKIQKLAKKNKIKSVWKNIGIGFLSIISSDMILMLLLGNSVEGLTALVLLFIVAIPFFILYYYLFHKKSRH